MLHKLISHWERNFIYKSNSFFQYLIIRKVYNFLMKNYIFFEIFKDLIFSEKSLHPFVRFFQLCYKMIGFSSFKFYYYQAFQISSKCIYLPYLFWGVISYLKSFSRLMNHQSSLQQQSQGLSNWSSGRAKAHTYFFLTKSLIWLEASVDYTLPKIGKNVIGDSCR